MCATYFPPRPKNIRGGGPNKPAKVHSVISLRINSELLYAVFTHFLVVVLIFFF